MGIHDATSLFAIGQSETRGRKKINKKKAHNVFVGVIPYRLSAADMHGKSV